MDKERDIRAKEWKIRYVGEGRGEREEMKVNKQVGL